MSSQRVSWRAEDLVSASVRVGDRPVHAFWPVLRESFRWILLPPHRRASGDAISWEWKAERPPPVPGHADFAALRERLDAALVNLSAQLDQSDDASGALMGLRAVMESWVRGLIRSADGQLAAYAVATEAGWMIRSWGFPHPAKAVCAVGDDAEMSKPENFAAGADAYTSDHLSGSGGSRRRRHLLWWLAAAAGIAVVGLIVWRQPGSIDARSTPTASSTHENSLQPSPPGKEAVSDKPAIPIPERASVDDHRTADAPIKHSPRRSLTQASPASESSGTDGFSAVSSAVGQSDPAFAELSLGAAGQMHDSAAERAIVVPGRDSGRGDLAAGVVPPSGPVDALGPAASAPVASAVSGPPDCVLGNTPLNAASATPPIATPAPRTGAAPTIASVNDPSKAGVAAPLDLTLKSSPKKTPPNSGAATPPRTATSTRPTETDKLPLDPATPMADPSQDPAETVARAPQDFSAEPQAGRGTAALKAVTAKKPSSADPLADHPKDARTTSSPDVSTESTGKPSHSSSLVPDTTTPSGSDNTGLITLREPVDTRHLTVLMGEWRLVRIRDVVLATWPAEQAAAQVLRTAREQAWAQMQAAVPASFREARVRTGWSFRLSASALVPAPPVWLDATNGQPCADTRIRGDSILLSCTDLLPAVDRDARLIAADGRELARLTVSMKCRRFDVTMTPEVLAAAPWFTVILDPNETPLDRFTWKSLRPEVWPDQAWKHLREAPNVGVICYSAAPRRSNLMNGSLAVVDSSSGWALSRAITLQDNKSTP